MTQMCCDTTARQAYHLGFGVEFLSDATGTLAISNAAGAVTAPPMDSFPQPAARDLDHLHMERLRTFVYHGRRRHPGRQYRQHRRAVRSASTPTAQRVTAYRE